MKLSPQKKGGVATSRRLSPPLLSNWSLVLCEPNTWKVEAHVQISYEKLIEVSFHWSLNVWWTACCLATSLCTCYACILASHLCLEQRRASTTLLSFSVASLLCSFLWRVYLTSSHVRNKCFRSQMVNHLHCKLLKRVKVQSRRRHRALDKKKERKYPSNKNNSPWKCLSVVQLICLKSMIWILFLEHFFHKDFPL